MSDLTGVAVGNNRDHLVDNAVEIAARYFGTKCVVVELANEHAVMSLAGNSVAFEADFTAKVMHRGVRFDTHECPRCGARVGILGVDA